MNESEEKRNQELIDSCDYLGTACSANDCTGLIPAGVTNREELEAYEELYPYRPPKPAIKNPTDIC